MTLPLPGNTVLPAMRRPLPGRCALCCAAFALTLLGFCGQSLAETGLSSLADRLMGGGSWGQTVDLDDPCPAPQTPAPAAGDDLVTLQADIDRFSLCAERAEMLNRLNEAAMGQDSEEPPNANPMTENPGFRLHSRLEEKRKQLAIPRVSEEELAPPAPERSSKPKGKGSEEWGIVTIFGSGEGLQVRLRKKDGSVAQARAGTTLPDGSVVKQLSTSGIILTKDGQDKILSWME